jgi:hypothetical protein
MASYFNVHSFSLLFFLYFPEAFHPSFVFFYIAKYTYLVGSLILHIVRGGGELLSSTKDMVFLYFQCCCWYHEVLPKY